MENKEIKQAQEYQNWQAGKQLLPELVLMNDGQAFDGMKVNVVMAGAEGYRELRVQIFSQEHNQVVGDVLIGLSTSGEVRILHTTLDVDGSHSDEHRIAVYPLRRQNMAVDKNWN